MKDTLGDRIKHYESISEHYFTPKVPIIVRVDGRAFHTWVKKVGCKKPFDNVLIRSMFEAAKVVANEMQNCHGFYAQSDEVTFVMDDSGAVETQQWFGGRQNKIESITASIMTRSFQERFVLNSILDSTTNRTEDQILEPAYFDARAFQCPKGDVANVFLWRVRDWERNSLTMFCGQFFSHKELHGKSASDRHEMLHQIGHNWATECTDQQKNGSWWSPKNGERFDLTSYKDINEYLFGVEELDELMDHLTEDMEHTVPKT